jgi:branched-chain amino acid aminotransferase
VAISGALVAGFFSRVFIYADERRDRVPAVDDLNGNPNDGRYDHDVDREIWLDGHFVPWRDATLHVLSHAAQRGSLVFDYMSVHQSPRGAALFRAPEHIDRFFHSCELIGLAPVQVKEELIQALVETVRRNPGARAVKISAFLASIEVDVIALDSRVSIAIAAYDPAADVIALKGATPRPRPETLRLWIEKEVKNRRDDIVSPQAKVSANYVAMMNAKAHAQERGYDEILLIDDEGFVAEGPTTNVFWVDAEGHLHTPPEEKVLLGVTRSAVLAIAKHDGLEVSEARVRPEELIAASEVFVTGTTAGVWPVASIDDTEIADGSAGAVTLQLRKRFTAISSGEDSDFDHWLTYVDASS